MIDCRRAYIGTKMELKPEAFKGKMFKVNERKIFLKKIKNHFVRKSYVPASRRQGRVIAADRSGAPPTQTKNWRDP